MGDEGAGDGIQSSLLLPLWSLIHAGEDVGNGDDPWFEDEDVMMGGEEEETCRSTPEEWTEDMISCFEKIVLL